MQLGRGLELPDADLTEYDRFIIESLDEDEPTRWYKIVSDVYGFKRWALVTPKRPTLDYVERSGLSIIELYESQLE